MHIIIKPIPYQPKYESNFPQGTLGQKDNVSKKFLNQDKAEYCYI